MDKRKELFKKRLVAERFMKFAWSISGPVFKSYYGLLGPEVLASSSIWSMVIMLAQKKVRKNYSTLTLMKITLTLDIIYMVCMASLAYLGNLKNLMLFEVTYDGIYILFIHATSAKLYNEVTNRYTAKARESLNSNMVQTDLYVNLAGLAAGGLLSVVIGIMGIIAIKLAIMCIGVYYTIKAIRD